MSRIIGIVVAFVLSEVGCASAASAWTFVQDRLNDPVYYGTSGLAGQASGASVRIWGTNTGSPPDCDAGKELWPGLAAVYSTPFDSVTVEATGTLNGSGLGFCHGIALWQDVRRYVIYGVNYGVQSGVYYMPSRWTALGGWPDPGVMPAWTPLGGSIADPNGPHICRLDYDGTTVRFWFDGQLLDTLEYPMVSPSIRLVAYARTYGDSVDSVFSGIAVNGVPVPEPSALLALLCGAAGIAWRRRR